MSEEIWKDIPGYEGKYQASTEGKIRSLDRYVPGVNPYTGVSFLRLVKGRVLRPGRIKTGHTYVVLAHGENGIQVHQLIMKTFIGPTPAGMEILHKNGIPDDNRLFNLRFGTRSENILDDYKQGKRWKRLSIDAVADIRFRLFCGHTGVEIAKYYGVCPSTISAIKNGRLFSWIK